MTVPAGCGHSLARRGRALARPGVAQGARDVRRVDMVLRMAARKCVSAYIVPKTREVECSISRAPGLRERPVSASHAAASVAECARRTWSAPATLDAPLRKGELGDEGDSVELSRDKVVCGLDGVWCDGMVSGGSRGRVRDARLTLGTSSARVGT